VTVATRWLGVSLAAILLLGIGALPARVAAAGSSAYSLVDLGTLGGSYAEASRVSDAGQVVGSSLTAGDAESHAFSWTEAGGMVDLGTLGGGWSNVAGVNSAGLVVGTSTLSGPGPGPGGPYHAFAWTEATGMIDLGTLGGTWSQAWAVNHSGQVVGISERVGTEPSPQRAFVWTRGGGMVDIGTLGGNYAQAFAISDNGLVVGNSTLAGDVTDHAFLWSQAGGMRDLGTLGGAFSYAAAVNSSGQVAGYSYTSANTTPHAFSWTATGGMVDLGTLGGSSSQASAVSGSGEVVGSSKLPGSDTDHAFSWTASGGMKDLGALSAGWSSAFAVGADDRVFGGSGGPSAGEEHPFVWTPAGGMADLGTLGGVYGQPNGVNASGQAVGGASFPGEGQEDATLWQPPPALVTRAGTQLTLDGQPFRPIGLNIYNANSNGWCSNEMNGSALDDALTAIGGGKNAMRAWFFQQLATTNGARDWTAFDRTLAAARAHGYKVVATLIDQWGNCGATNGQGYGYKEASWYQGGYDQPDPSATVSYRDWVAEVVSRYKDDPTILAWQLVNEPEVGHCSDPDESEAVNILSSFASDVSGLIKSIDASHLVSLGTIGSGQCGASGPDYQTVMSIPTLDLCEYHDYTPSQLVPGDQYNGLPLRIQQCNALDKPLLVGELGVKPSDVGGTLTGRANLVDSKLCAQLTAGVAGVMLWAWDQPDPYDIVAGDPVLDVLSPWSDPAHTCSAPAAPAGLFAGAGDGRAAVAWVAPSSTGGSVIRSYTLSWSPGNGSQALPAGQTSMTVTGLTNGTTYTFTVTATNAAGTSNSSSPATVTPQAGSPTPAAVTATASPTAPTTVSTGSDPATTSGTATSLTVPSGTSGGTVSIVQASATEPSPTGYLFGGVQVDITAPAGSVTNPLILNFTLTPPTGAPLDQTTLGATNVYRAEGAGTPALIPDCTVPVDLTIVNPCVSSRQYTPINSPTYIQLTVRTTTASHWNSARPKPQPVAVSDSGYSPSTVTGTPGAAITWSFAGKKTHTVTDSIGLGPAGAALFGSRALNSGSYSFTFPAAGSYSYKSTVKGDASSGTVAVPVLATPSSGRTSTTFSVIWATNPSAGYVFDVQYRFKPAGAKGWKGWTNWQTGVAVTHATFVPSQGAGSYAFHARLRNTGTGRASLYSPDTPITVS
jgi:mannan endo-1,4-beta-mannosidase